MSTRSPQQVVDELLAAAGFANASDAAPSQTVLPPRPAVVAPELRADDDAPARPTSRERSTADAQQEARGGAPLADTSVALDDSEASTLPRSPVRPLSTVQIGVLGVMFVLATIAGATLGGGESTHEVTVRQAPAPPVVTMPARPTTRPRAPRKKPPAKRRRATKTRTKKTASASFQAGHVQARPVVTQSAAPHAVDHAATSASAVRPVATPYYGEFGP